MSATQILSYTVSAVLREKRQRGGNAAVVRGRWQPAVRVVAACHVRRQPARRRHIVPACVCTQGSICANLRVPRVIYAGQACQPKCHA